MPHDAARDEGRKQRQRLPLFAVLLLLLLLLRQRQAQRGSCQSPCMRKGRNAFEVSWGPVSGLMVKDAF